MNIPRATGKRVRHRDRRIVRIRVALLRHLPWITSLVALIGPPIGYETLRPSILSHYLQGVLVLLYCTYTLALSLGYLHRPARRRPWADPIEAACYEYFEHVRHHHLRFGVRLLIGTLALNVFIGLLNPANLPALLWLTTTPILLFSASCVSPAKENFACESSG